MVIPTKSGSCRCSKRKRGRRGKPPLIPHSAQHSAVCHFILYHDTLRSFIVCVCFCILHLTCHCVYAKKRSQRTRTELGLPLPLPLPLSLSLLVYVWLCVSAIDIWFLFSFWFCKFHMKYFIRIVLHCCLF